MKEFVINQNREYLMKHMGDISQLASTKRYELTDGKAKGIEAVDIKTGTGFEFTVLPGRGMDIAWASFRGVPVSYLSKAGIVSPAYYESEGMNWLRNFFAGLMTTCGLSNVGGPCEEEDPVIGCEKFGLHGRISNTGADNVSIKEEWLGNEFTMSVSGRVRQSRLHGENLTLKREVTARMGRNVLNIKDIIENEGFTEQPLMLLYHINIGYPILDDGSRFIGSSKAVIPMDKTAEERIKQYDRFCAPIRGARENCYHHDFYTDAEGSTYAGIVNDKLELGAYIRFDKNQLSKFTEWKMMNESEYVLGMEPANCYPIGRTEERKRGDLESIKPGQKKQIDLEIGILNDKKQIAQFEDMVKSLNQ